MLDTLRRDQRGLILIPAIAMVSVLALGTLHITDVTMASIVRIANQTSADAEALEGAIWHAQGMNLLVTLNIIMACILAVFLAIRLVVLGLVLVTALAVIGSFLFPGFAGAAAALARALDSMHRVEERVAKPVMNALKTVSNTERVVAAAVPWVAAALPVSRLNGDPFGVVLSVSMIPDAEQWFKDLGFTIDPKRRYVGGLNPRTQFPARLGNFSTDNRSRVGTPNKPEYQPSTPGAHALSKPRLIGKLIDKAMALGRRAGNRGAGIANSRAVRVIDFISGSLPAQEEDFFMVCSRSGELVAALMTKVLLGPLQLDQGAIEAFNSGFGKVIGSAQTVTCQPLSELSNSVLSEIDANVDAKCAEEKKSWEDGGPVEPGKPRHRKRTWTIGQQQECEKKQRKAANDSLGPGNTPDGKNNVDYTKDRAAVEEIKTAAIWGELILPKDSPLIHVWSVNLALEWEFAPADSEAEYRHACDAQRDTDGRTCGDNAMWRYGWYAKTIQLKSLPRELAAHIGDLLQGWINRLSGKAIQGVVARVVANLPKAPDGTGRPRLGPILGQPIAGGGSGGRHRAPDPTNVQDVLLRHFTGVRSAEAGNSYWSRKALGPWIGNHAGLRGKGFTFDDDLVLH
ncbi:MAG: hypothetical protein ABW321_24080 [Polyangiales bacterium]